MGVFLDKRCRRAEMAYKFDEMLVSTVAPNIGGRALRYYRIGIKITILSAQSIVAVSYQYRNSKVEKYRPSDILSALKTTLPSFLRELNDLIALPVISLITIVPVLPAGIE